MSILSHLDIDRFAFELQESHGNINYIDDVSDGSSSAYEKHNSTLISIDRVNFQYGNETEKVLKDVSIEINAGDTVAFVGATGSGKSTLMDLMMGLMQPTSGKIYCKGKDIGNATNLLEWQQQFSFVPQDLNFVDDTYQNNIWYYRNDFIDIDKILNSLELVNMKDFVLNKSKGLETSVGENGVSMSGGQKQRICIARALYKNSNIIFLDEATSALDNIQRKSVMQNLHNTGATHFIAHRLSTTVNCSKIILFDKGRVIDEGTYSELSLRSPMFQMLLRRQFES